MASDPDEPNASSSADVPQPPTPAPKAGRRLIAAFSLPQWFRDRPPGTPPTDEERERLKEWFIQQLRERPLTRDDFAPPTDPGPLPDEPAA